MKKHIEFKKLVKINKKTFNKIVKWLFDWWGKKRGYSLEQMNCYVEHSLNEDKLPIIYGLFLDGEIIGMYQFVYSDFEIRPDIYPWLANVYIDEKYRGKGYGRNLLEQVKDTAQKDISFNELFLYTKHNGLYEKFGFEFVQDFDTFSKEPRIQRLYKMNLKNWE